METENMSVRENRLKMFKKDLIVWKQPYPI